MMESESARVEREGGDANNMSVAVTRAFGDVDDRFAQYSLVCSRIFVSVFFLLAFFFPSAFSLASVADVVLAVAEKSEASAQCPQVRAQRDAHPRSRSALKLQHPTICICLCQLCCLWILCLIDVRGSVALRVETFG